MSLCHADFDFQIALSKIKERVIRFFTDYKLNQQPFEETIDISINGKKILQSTENGWDYHSKGNFIRFYGEAIPAYHDKVKVDFSPQEAR